jgi:hypothetical protein
MSNQYITYNELIELTRIEDLLDKYYNSGDFSAALAFVIPQHYQGNAFLFYEELARYWASRDLFKVSHRKEAIYSILSEFMASHPDHLLINEILKLDYLTNYKAYELPRGIDRCNPPNTNDQLNSLLKNQDFIDHMTVVQNSRGFLRKNVVLEFFRCDPVTLKELSHPMPILFVYAPSAKQAVKIIYDVEKYLRQ